VQTSGIYILKERMLKTRSDTGQGNITKIQLIRKNVLTNASPYFITSVPYPLPREDARVPKSVRTQVIEALSPMILVIPSSKTSHEPKKRVLPSFPSRSQSSHILLFQYVCQFQSEEPGGSQRPTESWHGPAEMTRPF